MSIYAIVQADAPSYGGRLPDRLRVGAGNKTMAWVYILQIEAGKYYIGSTDDIYRRLKQHTRGHTATTKRLKIQALLLSQEYKTLKDARSVERKVKNLKRRDYIEKMIKDGYIKVKP